jgi:hypothetical protein
MIALGINARLIASTESFTGRGVTAGLRTYIKWLAEWSATHLKIDVPPL